MERVRYLVSAPAQQGAAALVEFRPFKAALACDDGLISAVLQSYSSRTLKFEVCADEALALLARPNMIELMPGASQRIRIGLRLGALHVERAFSLVLRETSQRRDASPLRLQFALPLIVTRVECGEALRAA
jgi:hypothetical protein